MLNNIDITDEENIRTTIYPYLVALLDIDTSFVCFKYFGSVISGIRTKLRNSREGGDDYSWHLDDLAKDIVFDNIKGLENAKKYLEKKGWRVVTYDYHELSIHVQLNLPIAHNYERLDKYSHLIYILDKYPDEANILQAMVNAARQDLLF